MIGVGSLIVVGVFFYLYTMDKKPLIIRDINFIKNELSYLEKSPKSNNEIKDIVMNYMKYYHPPETTRYKIIFTNTIKIEYYFSTLLEWGTIEDTLLNINVSENR